MGDEEHDRLEESGRFSECASAEEREREGGGNGLWEKGETPEHTNTHTLSLEIVYIYSFIFNLCCESFTIKWFNSPQSIELCRVFGWSFTSLQHETTDYASINVCMSKRAHPCAYLRGEDVLGVHVASPSPSSHSQCTKQGQGTLCDDRFHDCFFYSLRFDTHTRTRIKLSYFRFP